MAIEVSSIQERDIEHAVTCIQRAFTGDPYNRWIFDKPEAFNEQRNRASLRSRCYWGMRFGIFHVAKDPASTEPDKVLGVACWLAPDLATLTPPATWPAWLKQQAASWSLWMSQLATNAWYLGRGGLNARRYWVWKAAQASAQSALWDDAAGYYFCNIMTVLPEHQGRGIGRKMFEAVTDVADAEGRTCYLESSRSEPNVEIYRRVGFEMFKEMDCRDGPDDAGVTLYCMKRLPRAGSRLTP